MKPRTQAELDAQAALDESLAIATYADYHIRRDLNKYTPHAAAFGTGTTPQAHAEAQESGALQAEYERGRSEPREYISRGGRR